MLLQAKKRAAYYGAVAIFFGAVELFIPKPLPFFRLGIANIPVLLALDMRPLPFLLLLALKGLGNSWVSGNIFSVFLLITLMQSITSGLAMYGVKRLLKDSVSLYSISSLGALVSALVQILLASLYVGLGAMAFLPWMLIVSLASSILVAFLAKRLRLPEEPPEIEIDPNHSSHSLIPVLTMLISAGAIMVERTWMVALLSLTLTFTLMSFAGRRIMPLPFIMVILFMTISSIITPDGRVLFSLFGLEVTEGALLTGLMKGLKLSSGVALSQGYSALLHPSKGVIGETLAYFTGLLSSYRETEGEKVVERVRMTLSLSRLSVVERTQSEVPSALLIAFTLIFLSLSIVSFFI